MENKEISEASIWTSTANKRKIYLTIGFVQFGQI